MSKETPFICVIIDIKWSDCDRTLHSHSAFALCIRTLHSHSAFAFAFALAVSV